MALNRVLLSGVISASLGMASYALAGQESTSGLPSRSMVVSTAQQTACTQQTPSSFFSWLSRPREGNVECTSPSAVVIPAPLVLGTGY
jgi:hypothetical protein